MYCKKCGKQTENELTLCPACEAAETFSAPIPAPESNESPAAREGSAMEGFKPALASTIMSVVGFYFSYFAFMLAYFLFFGVAAMQIPEMAADSEEFTEFLMQLGLYDAGISLASGLGLCFLCLIGIGLAIPSIIFGVKSIKLFIKCKNEGKVKPIPALILGINGVAEGVSTLLLAVCSFLLMLCTIAINAL